MNQKAFRGEQLKKARLLRGLTLTELATQTGITTTLSNFTLAVYTGTVPFLLGLQKNEKTILYYIPQEGNVQPGNGTNCTLKGGEISSIMLKIM